MSRARSAIDVFWRKAMAETPKMLMEKEGPLGWIIFNQPEKRNAVSQEMWQVIPDMV
jgi:enoyl-CoA hydratase/carnithine racemase